MKIYFTCFSNEKYIKLRKQLCEKAKKIFAGVFEYDYNEFLVNTNFYQKNIEILNQRRGCGYWLWKPYIIIETMKKINQDDVIFYMDSADIFENRIIYFLKEHFSKNNVLLLDGAWPNKCWTKYDCFHIMKCNKVQYKDVIQLEAGVCGFKKTPFVKELLLEWLYYCQNKNIIIDGPNIYGDNDPCFVDHRHDQSILTNLKVKRSLPSCANDHEIRSLVICNVNIV